jgi:hypothetical protein
MAAVVQQQCITKGHDHREQAGRSCSVAYVGCPATFVQALLHACMRAFQDNLKNSCNLFSRACIVTHASVIASCSFMLLLGKQQPTPQKMDTHVLAPISVTMHTHICCVCLCMFACQKQCCRVTLQVGRCQIADRDAPLSCQTDANTWRLSENQNCTKTNFVCSQSNSKICVFDKF